MKVLVVKTSSMGDLLHTLPALTDAHKAIPGIQFDWVAEEAFVEIPQWHPAVDKTIPITIRRWRKHPLTAWHQAELSTAIRNLKQRHYDYVIDAQGLIKSAVVSRFAKGLRCGLDKHSCREPLAARVYQQHYAVSKDMHAIERVRHLFAQVLNYSFDCESLDYGLSQASFNVPIPLNTMPIAVEPYLVFLHGASRDNKLWSQSNWADLLKLAKDKGYNVYFPWGNPAEYERASSLCAHTHGQVLPKMTLTDIARFLAGATGVVGVDSGLAHLAAALGIPGVTLYVSTLAKLTGARGQGSVCLSYNAAEPTQKIESSLSVTNVWANLQAQMGSRRS